MKNILIVDDEKNMCKILKIVFEKDGFLVEVAYNGSKAIEVLEAKHIDLVIADLKMPDMDGIELLKKIQTQGLRVPFMIISAYGTITSAVEAMKLGAVDFITKPFNKDLIRHRVNRIMHRLSDYSAHTRHLPITEKKANQRKIIYNSEAMKEVMETVDRIASIPRPVMLLGESGTGKEMIANEIHRLYEDSKNLPFVSINCPALPETLFESELFGYKKGAFTGAAENYQGKLKAADGGTLFLDEIAELPMSIQAKFLRFLEEKSFCPLGSIVEVRVNPRIICAANKDLHELVKQGQFRKDLYYRLNTLVLRIPPLRERCKDIPPMVEYFNSRLSEELCTVKKEFSYEVLEAFQSYLWPGNVRELKNIVERIFLMSKETVIQRADLPEEILSSLHNTCAENNTELESDVIAHTEKQLLKEALETNDWNLTRAAKRLGISRSAIRWRIKKYGLKEM